MTRKDYIVIAEAMKASRPEKPYDGCDRYDPITLRWEQWLANPCIVGGAAAGRQPAVRCGAIRRRRAAVMRTLWGSFLGKRIYQRIAQVPGSFDTDLVFEVEDWIGIWFTLDAVCDYIAFRVDQ